MVDLRYDCGCTKLQTCVFFDCHYDLCLDLYFSFGVRYIYLGCEASISSHSIQDQRYFNHLIVQRNSLRNKPRKKREKRNPHVIRHKIQVS